MNAPVIFAIRVADVQFQYSSELMCRAEIKTEALEYSLQSSEGQIHGLNAICQINLCEKGLMRIFVAQTHSYGFKLHDIS